VLFISGEHQDTIVRGCGCATTCGSAVCRWLQHMMVGWLVQTLSLVHRVGVTAPLVVKHPECSTRGTHAFALQCCCCCCCCAGWGLMMYMWPIPVSGLHTQE
jgi:hypothetical protein